MGIKNGINKQGYSVFNENFVDENGNPTNGSVIQIIFGSKELRKKSINDRFVLPSTNFNMSIEQIKRLIALYPLWYDLYEKAKAVELRKSLKINDAIQQREVLKGLLKEDNLANAIPDSDLTQLEMIYHLRLSKELLKLAEKTGGNRFNIQPNESDKIISQNVMDKLFLRREPEFMNEMTLVYLATIFKEYLKKIVAEVSLLYPEMKIEDIPDGTDKLLGLFKNHLRIDLEKLDFEWKPIEEILLRRNVLIHYGGYPDEDYKKKTGHIGDSRLKTDTEYIKESLKAIENSQHTIQNILWSQYGNPKFLEQMTSEDILEE